MEIVLLAMIACGTLAVLLSSQVLQLHHAAPWAFVGGCAIGVFVGAALYDSFNRWWTVNRHR